MKRFQIEINWTNAEAGKTHCVGVYLFNRIAVSTLVDGLIAKSILEPNETQRMVQAKLSIADSDFEIETSTLKVALVCPLMKCRMQLPARARDCKHVQCFDLQSYLLMNEKKPSWLCPVCDKPAPYDALIIDGLFKSILEKVKDVDEVEFTPDGQWTKVAMSGKGDKAKSSKSAQSSSSGTNQSGSTPVKKNVEEICCDDGSPTNSNGSSAGPTTSSVAAAAAASSTMPTSLFNGHSGKSLIFSTRI